MSLPPPTGEGRQRVRISSNSNRVTVVAERRSDVEVDGRADVVRDGPLTTVISVAGKLVIRVPEGSDLTIGTSSGRVDVQGLVGNVAIATESGRITVEHAASVDARTTSARIAIGTCSANCRLRSTSGAITVESCCDADVATDSGRIDLDDVNGSVHAHCVSGRIDVGLASANDVNAETVSGRIDVSLPAGVRARQTTSSQPLAADSDEADCTIYAHSVNGRVAVTSR